MCFACDRPKDDATALSSPAWHIGEGPYWAGLTDWTHSAQGCRPHGHNVLDTPLQAGECVCSRTDCGYVFHNLGADIITLAFSNCSMWHTRAKNPCTTHVTVLPGLQLREHCCSYNFGLPKLSLRLVGVSIQQQW